MRARGFAAVIAAGCVGITACSSGHDASTTSATSARSAPTACTSLTIDDVQQAAGVRPAQAQTLQPAEGTNVRCGVLFVDGAGSLVVEVRALRGAPALADFRAQLAPDIPASHFRPLADLGTGAFVADRAVGFVAAGETVTLRAGFAADGRISVNADQLVSLAHVVAARLRR